MTQQANPQEVGSTSIKDRETLSIDASVLHAARPEDDELYSSWMLVKKLARKKPARQGNQVGARTGFAGELNRAQDSLTTQPILVSHNPSLNKEGTNEDIIRGEKDTTANIEVALNLSSRFRALAELDLNKEIEINKEIPHDQLRIMENIVTQNLRGKENRTHAYSAGVVPVRTSSSPHQTSNVMLF